MKNPQFLKLYNKGYEMRRYPSVNWVCSEATYKMGRDSENNMFMKLFRSYIPTCSSFEN